MKFSKKAALLVITIGSLSGLVGCKSNAKMPVNFVAVTSSSYNAEYTFGDYDYKFQGKINQSSNKFTLAGIAVARHATASSGGQGGPGGFPGGGFPGGGPGGNSSGPTFEGFGAEEQQQGGQQGGEGQGQQGGDPFGGQGQGGEGQGQQGGNPFGGEGQQGGEGQGQQGGDPFGGQGQGGEGQGQQQGGEQQGGEGQQGNPFGGGDNPFGGNDQPGGQGGEQQQAVAPESLTLALSLEEAFVNQSVTATVTAAPEGASNSVTWASSDEKIATVNNGSISPVAEGTVTITATSTVDPTKSASAQLKVVKEDLEKYNWAVEGTYVYEKGYGYKITFNDEGKTVIHTDFDRTEGRHSFYYNVKIGDTSETILFQAKDPTFKDSLVKDYKKWDERDSTYIFYAKATGNNNSVATAYMYLHGSDNSVVLNNPNGANRSLTFGMTWEKKGEQIIVHDGDTEYVAEASVNAEHPGYRLVYSGNTYYCSLNPEFKWKKFVTADFEGANTHEFVGSYTTTGPDGGTKEVNFNLLETGAAKLYLGSSTASFVGEWSKDANNKLTITLEGKTAEFVPNAEGKYEITLRVSVSSFFGSSTQVIVLSQVK